MRFLTLTFGTIVVLAIVFGGVLYIQLQLDREAPALTATQTATTTTNKTGKPSTNQTPPNVSPGQSTFSPPTSSFKGPTGAPHVTGPTSPPPNY